MRVVSPKISKETGKQREGKGFSRAELAKAGIVPQNALRLDIPLDPKRKTFHEENVETLKQFLQDLQPAPEAGKKG